MRLMSQVIGVFLVAVGLAFLALLMASKWQGEFSGDLRVSAFMIGFGSVLILIGCTFFGSQHNHREQPGSAIPSDFDQWALRLRSFIEVLAAAGGLLMLAHALAVCAGATWPSLAVLWMLICAPVFIGLLTMRILVPAAFQSCLFPNHTVMGWSRRTRAFVNLVLRVAWLGYLAIPLNWADLSGFAPQGWHRVLQLISSALISTLYASQVLILHLGHTRSPKSQT